MTRRGRENVDPALGADAASQAGQPALQTPADPTRAALVAALFREHNESLIRFLAARMRSRHEAREVAQEAYVRMLSLHEPGAVSFMRAFLFRTAANIAIDRLRSQVRRQHLQELSLFDETEDTATPERMAAERQQVEIVQELIAELPPKCRRAFLLNRVNGLAVDEIARQMGVAERTVRHYILQGFLHCRAGVDAAEANERTRA